MKVYTEKDCFTSQPDYGRQFWNMMKGGGDVTDVLARGRDTSTGGFRLPFAAQDEYSNAIEKESAFRKYATVINAFSGPTHIFAKDCSDLALWVPENGEIPVYDGMNDFTRYELGLNKLAVFVKFDTDLISDKSFDFEDMLTKRLAKNFAKAEDAAFINGGGEHEPVGLLDPDNGASIGVTANAVSFDDVIRLYFSLDPEYRKNAVWIMNDDTALKLRLMKDGSGAHLWDQTSGTILGRPVVVSNDMPSEGEGVSPVLFGDLAYYWIVCRSPVSVRTLKEKFVLYDQIGYLATEFMDAKLVRREAVKALHIG